MTTLEVLREKRARLADLERRAAGWTPIQLLPHQHAPAGSWWFWLLEGGRGSGKSVTASKYIADHLDGPPCISTAVPHRAALIAPTIGDAVESAELNEISLTRIEPGARLTQARGGSMVLWPNGSQVRLFGTHTRDDFERLRAGGNRCIVWAEELAAWRNLEDSWQQMLFGLRLGPRPQVVASTTPKPRPEYKTIREQASHVTNAHTDANPHLNPERREFLYTLFDGTSLGAQELRGELITEAEGALWTMTLINDGRLPPPVEPDRVVVAVDPPGGKTEAGIVAAGTLTDCRCGNGPLPHFAVLEDVSAKLTPDGWGTRTVDLFWSLGADRVVAERNYGGDMVEQVIRTVDRDVSFRAVTATRGKRVRAEPVKALYEQGRVHHIGYGFEALEAEMVQWIPDESGWSPNRLDALVWALTELSTRTRRDWVAY